LNIFLVSTFCEIVKNGPYILKKVKKNLISFSIIKNGPFCLFFNGMLICGPHHFNFSPCILQNKQEWSLYFKKEKKSHNFLKYMDHSCLFYKMQELKLKWWGPEISIPLKKQTEWIILDNEKTYGIFLTIFKM
jgi:hypothetical protein